MAYIKPIPVKRENIKVGSQYYTCGYSGSIKVTVIKIFDDGAVLVKTKVTIQNHPYSKMKSGWPEIAFLIAS